MYSAWIKLDDSLPWIELEEAFQTKAEAQKAVEEVLSKAKIKISELTKQEKEQSSGESTALKAIKQ
jgi:hypothetical protein